MQALYELGPVQPQLVCPVDNVTSWAMLISPWLKKWWMCRGEIGDISLSIIDPGDNCHISRHTVDLN